MNSICYIGDLRNGSRHIVLFMTTILMISIMLIPDLSFIGTETMILVSAMWLGTIVSSFGKQRKLIRAMMVSAFLYFFLVFFYKFLGISEATWDIAAGYFGWMMTIIIGTYAIQIFPKVLLRWIEYVVMVVVVISIVYVTLNGQKNMLIMNMEDVISQESAAYGSSIMLFSGICFIALLGYKSKFKKIIYAIALLLALNLNFTIMQRGTNVVFTVLMLILIFIFRKSTKSTAKFILFTFLIVILIYSTGVYIAFLDFLVGMISSERVASRIASISIFLQTGDYLEAGTSFATRSDLTLTSLKTFYSSFSNFLFGIGDSRGFSTKIGDHSEIIDSLARYGILGFTFIFSSFCNQFRYLSKFLTVGDPIRYQILIVFIIYVPRNVIGNSMTSAIGILLFLYMPVVIYFIKIQKIK